MALTQISQAGAKDEAINEAKIQISNAGTNGQYLQKQSGNTGGLTWADVPAGVGGGTGLDVNDNVKIRLGTGNDLELYHDGSHSFIKDAGTGNLRLGAADLRIQTEDFAENYILGTKNGSVDLYYDNAKKLETTSWGAKVTGNFVSVGHVKPHLNNTYDLGDDASRWRDVYVANDIDIKDNGKLLLGDGDDLEIYHNGSASYIVDNGTGDLILRASDQLKIQDTDNGENMAIFNKDGAVELYHNNVKTFSTNSAGINLWGPEAGDCVIDMFADEGDDNADSWRLRAGQAGVFYLQNLAPGSWDNFIAATANGGVSLYYDNVKKFETTNTGAQISGNDLTITDAGDVNINLVADSDNTDESHVPTINFTNDSNQLCLKIGIEGSAGDTLTGTTANTPYISAANGHGGTDLDFGAFNAIRMKLTSSALRPIANDTYDLGSSSYRWRNVYTGDLNLSNEGSSNDIDSTWGDWTIQEGESDLFLKNNRSGKKYKFNLTEVS